MSKKDKLTQNIVIEGAQDEAVGAQAIEPEFAQRADARASTPMQLRPAVPVEPELQRRIEQFLFWQSELLDSKQWQRYIDLFTDDGVYWMPVTPDQTDWESAPSIFAEDKPMMEVRAGRISHPMAWSQAPMWATSHLVGNIVIESDTPQQVAVRSRFQMMELRRDTIRHFAGTYRHTLVAAGDGFRIRLQRVDLFNGQAPFDYVLQAWV